MVLSSSPDTADTAAREALFRLWVERFAGPLERLCRSYEYDPEARRDLAQRIWLALWQSLPSFRGDSSDRTWFYRVAQNVALTHIAEARRNPLRDRAPLTTLEDLAESPPRDLERADGLAWLQAQLEQLRPLDRQVLLLYLEELPASDIATVTGLSASNVATKILRLKVLLAKRFRSEVQHVG